MSQKEQQKTTPPTLFDIQEHSDRPGPRPGLGGWGLPGFGKAKGKKEQIGPIVGYGMEKIQETFAVLRDLSLEGQDLLRDIQVRNLGRPGQSTAPKESAQRKRVKEAFDISISTFDATPGDLAALLSDDAAIRELKNEEKLEALQKLAQETLSLELQAATLTILRSSTDTKQFEEFIETLGGAESVVNLFKKANHGIFICLLERFKLAPWSPPFHNAAIFSFEGEEHSKENPINAFKEQLTDQAIPIITEEHLNRFLSGDITTSGLMNLSRDELYQIAERGYELLQEGKFEQAQIVFDGLVYLDPYDPYFHTVLGSVNQKQEQNESAILCYTMALRLQSWNVTALANRGEVLFNMGMMQEALVDFQAALMYDPKYENPSTKRVQALLLSIHGVMQEKGLVTAIKEEE